MQSLIDPAILLVVVREFFQFRLGKSEHHNFLRAWLWGWNRVGVKALVLEQSGALRTEGTSLTLFPNAWRALNALGVADEIRGSFLNLTGYWTLLAISEDYLLSHLGPKQQACANGARKAFGNAPTFTILLNKQFKGCEGYILQSSELQFVLVYWCSLNSYCPSSSGFHVILPPLLSCSEAEMVIILSWTPYCGLYKPNLKNDLLNLSSPFLFACDSWLDNIIVRMLQRKDKDIGGKDHSIL